MRDVDALELRAGGAGADPLAWRDRLRVGDALHGGVVPARAVPRPEEWGRRSTRVDVKRARHPEAVIREVTAAADRTGDEP